MRANAFLLIPILQLLSVAIAAKDDGTVTLLSQAILDGEDVDKVLHPEALDRRHYGSWYDKNAKFKKFCSRYLSITPYAATKTVTTTARHRKTVTCETKTTITRTVATRTSFITERPTFTQFFTETVTEWETVTGVPPEPTLAARDPHYKDKHSYYKNKKLSSSCRKVVHPKTKTVTKTTTPTTTVTVTRTKTKSATALTTATVTLPVTESATTTTTVTSTSTVNPCDTVEPLGWIAIIHPLGGIPARTTRNTHKACCEDCYRRPGCVFWASAPEYERCSLSFQDGATEEDQCPLGVQPVRYVDGTPAWAPGPCGSVGS
ncbi:hypothetical protein ACJZ2D_004472 [Fusarium nematophilum]